MRWWRKNGKMAILCSIDEKVDVIKCGNYSRIALLYDVYNVKALPLRNKLSLCLEKQVGGHEERY